MDVLKIQNASVLGYSLDSSIAKQIAANYPEKVNSLVLFASSCGGKESIPRDPRNLEMVMNIINRVANGTVVPSQKVKEVTSIGQIRMAQTTSQYSGNHCLSRAKISIS
jgi:pimeloyl-ACP methyl ester carboxylesterase